MVKLETHINCDGDYTSDGGIGDDRAVETMLTSMELYRAGAS